MTSTFVSGYWPIGRNFNWRHFESFYQNLFHLQQRMFIFCDSENNSYIQSFRPENIEKEKTFFYHYPFENFSYSLSCSTRWKKSDKVPFRELAILYHEKVNLLKIAKEIDEKNGTRSDFYIWIDSWNCPMPLRSEKIEIKSLNVEHLPHDKVCYSHLNEAFSSFCSSIFIVHHSIIDQLHELYYSTLSNHFFKNLDWKASWDQSIFTFLLETYPSLFEKIAEGHGKCLTYLTS